MSAIKLLSVMLIILQFIALLTNGRNIIRNHQRRSANQSRLPLFGWSSTRLSPVPDDQATFRAVQQPIVLDTNMDLSPLIAQFGTNGDQTLSNMAQRATSSVADNSDQQPQQNNVVIDKDEEEEPLVYSSYNRDCFFTPVNCFVGRAGQQATKIIGTAFNSKRQILFIRRTPKMM